MYVRVPSGEDTQCPQLLLQRLRHVAIAWWYAALLKARMCVKECLAVPNDGAERLPSITEACLRCQDVHPVHAYAAATDRLETRSRGDPIVLSTTRVSTHACALVAVFVIVHRIEGMFN